MKVEGKAAIVLHDAVVLRGVPAEGIEIALEAALQKPIPLTILDLTPGLPPASAAPVAQAVHDARDARAVQTQEGDVSILARHMAM